MTKILFICLGNICRSPMAEVVLRDMVRAQGKENGFFIASAATSREEISNPIYPPARRELERRGHKNFDHRAVQLQKADYDRFDLVIGMEESNIRNILRIFGSDPAHKVHRLLDFTEAGGEIDDPWYTGDFAGTYDKIEAGCQALLRHLTSEKESSHR